MPEAGLGAVVQRLNRAELALKPPELTEALRAVGLLAKNDMIEAIVPVLGPKRSFSGWKRLGKLDSLLKVGPQEFTISPVPYGGWIVADSGRRPGSVAPSRGNRLRVTLKTPWGPRTYLRGRPLRIGPTKGHRVLRIGSELIRARSAARLEREIQLRLRKIYGAA